MSRDQDLIDNSPVCPIARALALHLAGCSATVSLVNSKPAVIARWLEVHAIGTTVVPPTESICWPAVRCKINARDRIFCPGAARGIGASVHPCSRDREASTIVPTQLLFRAIEVKRALHEAFLGQGLVCRAESVLVAAAMVKADAPRDLDLGAPLPSFYGRTPLQHHAPLVALTRKAVWREYCLARSLPFRCSATGQTASVGCGCKTWAPPG
mmetsp:Transcript_23694/g.39113  ORF Transcript_23694/g.39113 Transcript_23694/m.39113 type:complete len:212 (+) Transcript_23694:428-1063(+)